MKELRLGFTFGESQIQRDDGTGQTDFDHWSVFAGARHRVLEKSRQTQKDLREQFKAAEEAYQKLSTEFE